MKFGNCKYAIIGFAGSQKEAKFCTIEELVKGSANRICTYSSKGDALFEAPLGVAASHLEVDASFRRALIYSYAEDSMTLYDMENRVTLLKIPCQEPHFFGFVENAAMVQDISGNIWRLDEATGLPTREGKFKPILAWASDGSLMAIKHDNKSIIISKKGGERLFSIPRVGIRSFDPDIAIADPLKDILLIEPEGGLRLFSAEDHECKLQLKSTEHISFEFGCLTRHDSEVVCLAYDMNTEHESLFYRAKHNQMTEICRVKFAPVEGHFMSDGTLFASNTGDIIDLSASIR